LANATKVSKNDEKIPTKHGEVNDATAVVPEGGKWRRGKR